MEDENMSQIQKRQRYYSRGRAFEENGKVEEAIQAYTAYSAVLAEKDKHIPYLWISRFYLELDDKRNYLDHLMLYAAGCSDAKASEFYKKCGDGYSQLNMKEEAFSAYQLAKNRNPKITVKSKIQELNK